MRRNESARDRLRLPARIFVYEHISGGGLASCPLPGDLARQGRSMLLAALEDLAAVPGIEVVTTLDGRVDAGGVRGTVHRIHDAAESARLFSALSRDAAGTLVIAPETGGALERFSRRVLAAGGRLLGSRPRAVRACGDKLEAARRLIRGGVPAVPAARLRRGRPFPEPVVVKPRRGAGSEGIALLAAGASAPENARGMVVTPYIEGVAASVLFLVGDRGHTALLPRRQVLSEDGGFRFLGTAPLPAGLARRAIELSERAIARFPGLAGFVGVDLVLSESGGHPGDRVVEVNPRLTSSYPHLRPLSRDNLAGCWLDAWLAGVPGSPRWRTGEPDVELSDLPHIPSARVGRPAGGAP